MVATKSGGDLRKTSNSTIHHLAMVATKSGGDLRKTSNSTIHHLAMVATKSGGDLCKTSNHNHPPSGDGGYQERWRSVQDVQPQPSTIWRWWLPRADTISSRSHHFFP
jgi:hypothetical protein